MTYTVLRRKGGFVHKCMLPAAEGFDRSDLIRCDKCGKIYVLAHDVGLRKKYWQQVNG